MDQLLACPQQRGENSNGMEGMRPAPYSEHLPRAAPRRYVLCTWTARMARKEAYVDQVLPDACMDVFWDGSDIWVAGPDTGPVSVSREPGSVIVGIRFRPGAGPAILGPSGHELLNARPRLADIWGRRAESLAARLHDSGSADEARTVLDAVFAREAGFRDPDDAMELVVLLLSAGPSQLSIRGVASEVGLSERQLHRRSLRSFGYGVKTLERILRFRRFLGIAAMSRPDLATTALACGYADQAHLTRECRMLSGRTPRSLLATAGDVRFLQDEALAAPLLSKR
jgi:AraC-like DNA-binding protein